MTLDGLGRSLPDHARDLRINLGSVTRSEHLSEGQVWGAVLASALATRHPGLIRAAAAEAGGRLDEAALRAARAAAAIMAMNNVYYRFVHLVGDEEYGRLPARLRMAVMADPGVDAATFELWSLAVSAIHGCGRCMQAHERAVRAKGLSSGAVQDAVRIASVVHAVGCTLEAEATLAGVSGDEQPACPVSRHSL
jgi:alkyl hydroperoxide reductase subunit D